MKNDIARTSSQLAVQKVIIAWSYFIRFCGAKYSLFEKWFH